MKKRLFSIFMALCLCLTLLPATALAATDFSGWTVLQSSHGGQTLSDGNYYLTGDVTISSTILISNSNTVTLDLNGHTLTYNGSTGSVLKVNDSGNLTLQDSSDTKTGQITGGKGNDTGNGTGTTEGGGVYVSGSGTFTMTGGTITRCTATGAEAKGGGVYVEGTFTMSGTAAITGCSATGTNANGGGVYVKSGTLKMGAGTGAGIGETNDVFITDSGTIKIDGTVTNNNCLPIAAAVTLDKSSSKIQGGKFTGAVTNKGTIEGGTFEQGGTVTNSNYGKITGGTFSGTVTNNSGSIEGGTFNGTVKNETGGTITSSGSNPPTFSNAVTNEGTIYSGTFEQGSTVTNSGTITSNDTNPPTFSGTVNNSSNGTIQGGTFSGEVNNSGTIKQNGNISPSFNQGSTVNNSGTIEAGVNTGSATVNYAVTFDVNDGNSTAPETQYVTSGGIATKPDDPTKNGSYFMYWTTNDNPFQFESNTITAPITLKAKWGNRKDNLSYTTVIQQGGGDAPPEQAFRLEVYLANGSNGSYQESTKLSSTNNSYILTGDISLTTTGVGSVADKKVTVISATGFPTPGVLIRQVPVDENGNVITVKDGWTYDETVYYGSYQDRYGKVMFRKATETENSGEYTVDISTSDNLLNEMTFTHTYTKGALPVPTYAAAASETENGTVTMTPRRAERGSTVTITVKPDADYILDTLTVLDQNGKPVALTDNGDGTFSFKMPTGGVRVAATFVLEFTIADFFGDVPEDAYYHDAALWAAKNGIASGTAEGCFSPHASCGRAQLITFLWRAAGCPVVNFAMDFSDVDENAYYGEAVRWAASLGIVGGYGNGTFGTGDTITREQMATILYRFAEAAGMDVRAGENTNLLRFADASDVSEYATLAVQWAVGSGIMEGSGDKVMPHEPCTRAQIVTLLYRLLVQ